MWRILYYLTFGLVWLRCPRCGKRIPPSELVEYFNYSEKCTDCYYSDDEIWLCDCGNFIENGLHCPRCGTEPPWGCPCDCHDDYEDDLFDEYDEYVFEPDDE